jgi:hypothetical protein
MEQNEEMMAEQLSWGYGIGGKDTCCRPFADSPYLDHASFFRHVPYEWELHWQEFRAHAGWPGWERIFSEEFRSLRRE